jgi:hypothetical protein
MDNSDPLVWYGAVFTATLLVFLVVPYLRGKSDVLTAWNFLLLGSIIFTGVGCFEVKFGEFKWAQLQWFQPTRDEIQWFMWATTVFFVTLFVSYYYNPIARSIASKCLRKWPPPTTSVMLFCVGICTFIVALSPLTAKIFFVGPLLANVSREAAVFSCVFTFFLWNRNRANVLWLGLFIAVFLGTGLFSMLVSMGRRLLLSVLFVPVMCFYWTDLRYWKRTRALLLIGISGMALFGGSIAYSSIRHFSLVANSEERTASSVLSQVKGVGNLQWFELFLGDKLHYLSQYTVHYSLITQRYVDSGQLVPRPLNTLMFLASFPIPRIIWEDKPEPVGIIVVRDMVGVETTNWGVGIVGHGAFEGGIPALMLYAALAAFGIRLIDDPLKAQPNNPFLIAILTAAAPHLVAWPRGDIGTLTAEAIKSILFAIGLCLICRFLFGTDRAPQWRRAIAPGPFGYELHSRSRLSR